MKTNFKPHDKVTITESTSPVDGYSGTVLSNETDPNYKQKRLKVELDNGLGVWHFNYNDVELANEAKIKPQDESKFKSDTPIPKENKKPVKSKEVKIKRKYTKRK